MYARKSTLRFQPENIEEATRIIREVMIPSARKQRGFKGALMLRDAENPAKHIVISIWETEEDLLASQPPEEIVPLLEPLEEYIIDQDQEICDVLLYM